MTKPIITKDHFVACIKVLQDADDMACRINKIVGEYRRGDFIDGYAFSNEKAEIKRFGYLPSFYVFHVYQTPFRIIRSKHHAYCRIG